jgi:hypothetical protein
VVLHLAFTSGKTWHTQIQEKVRPQRLRTREPQCTCEEKERSVGKKKKKKKGEPGGKGAMRADSRKEGTPYSSL